MILVYQDFVLLLLINCNIKHNIVSKRQTIANCQIDAKMEKDQWKNILRFIASLLN